MPEYKYYSDLIEEESLTDHRAARPNFSQSPSSAAGQNRAYLLQYRKHIEYDSYKFSKQDYRRQRSFMPTPQELLILQMRKVCEEHGIPTTRVGEAVHVLLGSAFQPTLVLPSEAPALWQRRTGEDRDLNPIDFFNKYWGSYQEAGVLFQADLIHLDKPLYAAIERFCRYREIDPKDYLPLPRRKQQGFKQPISPPSR